MLSEKASTRTPRSQTLKLHPTKVAEGLHLVPSWVVHSNPLPRTNKPPKNLQNRTKLVPCEFRRVDENHGCNEHTDTLNRSAPDLKTYWLSVGDGGVDPQLSYP